MRSTLKRMDAYQLYQKYSESNTWLPTPEDYDTKNTKLVSLVLKMQEERPELPDVACSIDKLTEEMINLDIDEQHSAEDGEASTDTETQENEEITDEEETQDEKDILSDPETVQRKPHSTVKVETEKENGAIYTCAQARTLCDTLMVGKSKSRIKCIADTLHANVPIGWVHTFASKVIGATQPQFYRTSKRNTDSHIHVISGSILHFLSWCDKADQEYIQTNKTSNNMPTKNNVPTNITTFAWGEGNEKAIHIQKFNKRIREIFQGVPVSIAIMFIGSIGLPLHELFKPNDYIQRFQKEKFKFLNSNNIVKSTLRKFIQIKKISPDIEAAQLLQKYSTNKELFETIMPTSSVKQYLFKHWYSYPKQNELQNILVIAQQLLDLWRAGKQNITDI